MHLISDFTMLILVCIGVGFVILIAICVALIIVKLRRRNPPPSAMLLDADYRKNVLEPFPPTASDSGHYRSLVKNSDKSGCSDHHGSSSGAPSRFELSDGNNFNPTQVTYSGGKTQQQQQQQQQPHFSTIQSTGPRPTASREDGAPDYFVLDKQFC